MCLPEAVAGTTIVDAYSIAILVEPRQLTWLTEAGHSMRFTYIGQPHPTRLEPSWLGHSIGYWDGDTLVVDTAGFNGRNSLLFRIPMSDQLHVVERIRVVDGVLEDQARFDDPGAFTEPFTITTQFDRSEPYQEYICAENNHEGGAPTASGKPTPFTLPRTSHEP